MKVKEKKEQVKGKVFGYCRVSTDKQDNERQANDILEYAERQGLGNVTMVRETISGSKEKPELERLLTELKQGDSLLVWELSRLSRSGVSAVFEIVGKVRRVGAVLIETNSGKVLDDSISTDMIVFAMGLSAKIEKQMISDRTKSALRKLKEGGIKLGRPEGKSKIDDMKEEVEKYQRMKLSKSKIAELLKVSRSAYLNWLDKEKSNKG